MENMKKVAKVLDIVRRQVVPMQNKQFYNMKMNKSTVQH